MKGKEKFVVIQQLPGPSAVHLVDQVFKLGATKLEFLMLNPVQLGLVEQKN